MRIIISKLLVFLMTVHKSIISKKASQNLSGDTIYYNIRKVGMKGIFEHLNEKGKAWDIADPEMRDTVRGANLLDTLVQNLSFRSASELFEISKDDSKNGLDRLFESIQQKYKEPELVRDIFLKVVTSFSPTFVITPHPTETLTTDAITLERRLSETMHSKSFVDWAAGGFKPNDPVIKELRKNLKSLLKELRDNVPNANLDIRKEIIRGLKNTERFHDATEIYLNMVDRTLFKYSGQRLNMEDIDKYFSRPVHNVLGWQGTDQDGKKEARPWFIEEFLFPRSVRALRQQYMVQIAKIIDGFEKSSLKDDVKPEFAVSLRDDAKKILTRLVNDIASDEDKLVKFFDLSPEKRREMANSGKKDIRNEVPDIARFIYDKLDKATKNNRFGLNAEVISLLEEVALDKVAAIKNNQHDSSVYGDVRAGLSEDLTAFNSKYGLALPKHRMLNGVDCEYNSLMSVKTQIYTTGGEALRTQLRQNGADIEKSLVYALKKIEKEQEVELPQSAKDLIKYHDQKFNTWLKNIEELKQRNAILDINILKYSLDTARISEDIAQKGEYLDRIKYIEEVDLKDVKRKINDASAKLLDDIAANPALGDTLKKFISGRDELYHNDLKPSELAEKLALQNNPTLKPHTLDNKTFAKEKESQLSKDAAVIQQDIEAYDRLKSVLLLVDNPERMPHYISAECDGANTLFAQHILSKALVRNNGRVKNLIFSLPESVDAIKNISNDWKIMLENPYVLDQIKQADRNPPVYYDEKTGAEKNFTAAQMLKKMGLKDIDPSLGDVKIESKQIVMFPSSDIIKVYSAPAANFLIADQKYKLMQEFAKKGIYLTFEEGVGSSVVRGNPKSYDIGTIQGRNVRISQEAICSRDISHKSAQAHEHLDLPRNGVEVDKKEDITLKTQIEHDPRFNYMNSDFETFRYISNNPEKWQNYMKEFTKVGESYAELYESKPFSKYFAVGSYQEFAKLISFSARSVVKTGDTQKEFEIYPTETSVDKIRAIQFAASTSALNPHGGITIHSIFENNQGEFDLDKFNAVLKDYKAYGAERNPVLQESINKAAISLAQADLTCAWQALGFKRTRDADGGYIEIGDKKLRMTEIEAGQHDNVITDHLIKSGLYPELKANHQDDFNRKIFDEVVAIRTLAKMDIHTVKSRKYISMMMKAVDQGKDTITMTDFEKQGSFESKDTKQEILDCLPAHLRKEISLSNNKTNEAFERLSQIHIDLKKGLLKLPKKKNGVIDDKDANFPLYKELCYLVAQIMENRERVPTAMLQTEHARKVELEYEMQKALTR